MTIDKSFSVKFKALRKAMGMNQTDFGKMLRLKQTSVSTIEQGRCLVSMRVLVLLKELAKKHKLRIEF